MKVIGGEVCLSHVMLRCDWTIAVWGGAYWTVYWGLERNGEGRWERQRGNEEERNGKRGARELGREGEVWKRGGRELEERRKKGKEEDRVWERKVTRREIALGIERRKWFRRGRKNNGGWCKNISGPSHAWKRVDTRNTVQYSTEGQRTNHQSRTSSQSRGFTGAGGTSRPSDRRAQVSLCRTEGAIPMRSRSCKCLKTNVRPWIADSHAFWTRGPLGSADTSQHRSGGGINRNQHVQLSMFAKK